MRDHRVLFGTADAIGTETGGGVVTKYESLALEEMGCVWSISSINLQPESYRLPNSPYVQDYLADSLVLQYLAEKIDLAHFYSGMFSKTIWRLKNAGAKVTQTVAAHDANLSRQEFQKLGLQYDFPHLNERNLFLTYVEGQLMADRVICPSTASKRIVEQYGVRNAVVIPHGIVPPFEAPPIPRTFHVGYLGQVGPDKGLIYLLQAWAKLNFTGSRLLMAGRDVAQLSSLWNSIGKGEVEFMGFVKDVAHLYGRCSAYVQPSVTEGFGIEVLEAMAHGRPVIVSEGAGAADVVTEGIDGYVVPRCDPDAIADRIMKLKGDPALTEEMGRNARQKALKYDWKRDIVPMYQKLWAELLLRKCPRCSGVGECDEDETGNYKTCPQCGGTGHD